MKKHVSAKKARPRHVGIGKELRCHLRHEMNIVLTGQLVKPLSMEDSFETAVFFPQSGKRGHGESRFFDRFFRGLLERIYYDCDRTL